MSISVEKTGRNIQEAIQAALDELNVSEEEVVIEVLEEGDEGGILGIGRKEARVLVSIEDEPQIYYGDDEAEMYETEPIPNPELLARRRLSRDLRGAELIIDEEKM